MFKQNLAQLEMAFRKSGVPLYCWLGTRIKGTLTNYYGQMKQRSRIHSCFALHPTTCDNANPLFVKHCTGVILGDVAKQKPRRPQQKPNSRLHSCVKHLMPACSDCFQAAKSQAPFATPFKMLKVNHKVVIDCFLSVLKGP